MNSRLFGNRKAILVFSLPALCVFTLMVFYPVLQTVYRGFFDWDGLSPGVFTGLKNFFRLFQDPLFYQSTYNGVVFALVLVVFQISFATILALCLMNQRIPCKQYFRTAFFIPVVISVTVVCQLWSAIYNPEFGLINHIFKAIGLPYQQEWLSDMKWAIYAVAYTNVWQYTGYQFALIYAGVKSIPLDYLEAARIDGANSLQVNCRIVVPILADTYRMCLIFALTGGLNAFANMNLLTRGGPGTATYTLTYMTFRSAFTIQQYGYGCAVALMLIVQCLIVTMAMNRLFANKAVTY
ncbi:putative ABC transporter permease protein YurN [Spirochaetia bacterium]|nr:putative ABC transporter permease protein YurN [Spirochaetia bacterium]